MKPRTQAFAFASVLALAGVAALGCRPPRNDIGVNPYGDRQLGTNVWLFGFDSPQVRQLMVMVKKNQGLIAVRYVEEQQTLEVLPNCQIAGAYNYSQYAMRQKKLEIRNKDDLQAHLPLGYAAFSAAIEQQTALEIEYKSPGDYNAQIEQVSLGEGCEGATHVVEHVFVGAYVTRQAASSGVKAGGTANGPVAGMGPSAQGGSFGSNEAKTSAGIFETCEQNSPKEPPLDCSEPLSLSLRALGSIKTNVASCNDPALMSPTNGFSFTGQVFTLESNYLKALEPNADPEFACKPVMTPGEQKALARITAFLAANPGVKAHVSVWCTPLLPFAPMQPQQHEAVLRGTFAAAGLAGRVEFDHCMPGLIPLAGSNGVYVELTTGCKEFSQKPAFKCMPPH